MNWPVLKPDESTAKSVSIAFSYPDNTYDWTWLGNTNTSIRTPPTVSITNPRVAGNLAGTTQNALIGADLVLTASGSPSGGSYSWTFTGSPTIVAGATNVPGITVRWIQSGTVRATATYTQGGSIATYFLDIVIRVPTLTEFKGFMNEDEVLRNHGCGNYPIEVTYSLGCGGGVEAGMTWTTTATIPSVAYLSNPAQSGIKFVQAASALRKRLLRGNIQCYTHRSSESNVSSGWQLDTRVTYNTSEHPPQNFSQGNTLTMLERDSPGDSIESPYDSFDAYFASDYFETYVFYFTGNDPDQPIFQQALGLQGSGLPYARLAWDWGGQVRFDWTNPELYGIQFSNTHPDWKYATGTNSLQSMATNVNTNAYQPCAGASTTTNPIDYTLFFTNQLYWDFLGHGPDQNGLNFWRWNMTQCAFDVNCILQKRVDVTRAFFYSSDFIGTHPALGGTRGTHAYNEAFIFACYEAFLRRAPNAPQITTGLGLITGSECSMAQTLMQATLNTIT